MRIADKMQFEQVKSNIGKNRTQMSELQNQAATQKRVVKPSDDPMAASRVLANKIDLQGNQQYGKSLSYAKSFLEYTDQSLGELGDVLMRAKELAISQSNDGSGNENSRRVVATELDQLYNQVVAIGNRKLGDRFVFGGFHTQNSPFDEAGHYGGDGGEMMIHVDKETFLPMNIPGGRVFLGEGVSANGMIKTSPQQAKNIEDFERQKAQAQPQSAAMRGPASFPAASPELSSPNAATNANAGTGTANAPGLGGGAGAAPASGGPAVLGPATAAALADSAIADAQEEGVSNGVNLFRVLKDFSISLKANDKAGVQDSLEVLDDALNQVLLTRAQVGSRASTVDNFIQGTEKQKLGNKTVISQLEDADVFSTVSDINKAQSTLQATLETSGKLIQPSLMQFLR